MFLCKLYKRLCIPIKIKASTAINKLQLKLNGCTYDVGFQTAGLLFLGGNSGKLNIGKNVYINSASWANPIGGNNRTEIRFMGGNISIGDNTGISNAALASETSITIGANVLIGAGVCIYDTDFHPVDPKERMDYQKRKSKPVIIEDNVFIGAKAIILKGTIIGHNSVIGAGSVVSGIIPPNQIWGGNPAQFIKNI